MLRSRSWTVALAATLLVATPSRGDACGEPVVIASDTTVAVIKESEQLLSDGAPAQARAQVEAIMRPCLAGENEDVGLTQRARRILALATVRLDPDGHGGEYRVALLTIAALTLKGFADTDPSNTAKQTDLGEALAKTKPKCQSPPSWGQPRGFSPPSWGHPVARVMGPPARC